MSTVVLGKTCPRCSQEKPLEDFHADKTKKRGRSSHCKTCAREVAAEWRAKNLERSRQSVRDWRANSPEKMAAAGRKYRLKQYGLTPDDYDAMVAAQDGRCGICAQVSATLVVDHDHTTGEVRELLCTRCNVGIGHLDDDLERLRAAVAYLERHR